MIGAMLLAATAGSVPGSETDLPKELSETGSGCEADLHEEKTAAPVPGSEADLPKELSETGSGCEADLHEELGGGQVWRHARPVGIGYALFFSKQSSALWVLGMKFLERFRQKWARL